MHRSLLIAALLLGNAVRAESVQYDGAAYDLKSGAVMYRESHFLQHDGDAATRVVLYRCPAGAPFARKQLEYTADPTQPNFQLEDARLGYHEGVRGAGDTRVVFVQRGPGESEISGPVPSSKDPKTPVVMDAGFDDFVRRHWDALQRGDTVSFPFLVPSRQDWWAFDISKDRDEDVHGEPASVIRMSLGSWFGFLLPHIEVSYANARKELLRFAGISNVRDPKGKNYKVRIDFIPSDRKPLDPAAMQTALAQPLVKTCDG